MDGIKYPEVAKNLEKFFVIDEQLAKNVSSYVMNYITGNDQIDFFSSQLLGVRPIVMTDGHIAGFLGLFNMSMTILNGLTVKITDIDKNFRVQRDSLNVFTGSVLHLIENSKIRDKKKLQKDVIFFMVMRIFTSRYNHDFKTLRPRESSLRVYNAMSNAYDIKKYKTNLGVLQHKSELIYAKNVHGFAKNKTNSYARFVIDARGKTTSYINGWWTVYNSLSDRNFIETTSSLKSKSEEGDDILRDVIDVTAQQNEMGLKLMYGNLIDKEILNLVHEVITPTTPVNQVEAFGRALMDEVKVRMEKNDLQTIKRVSDSIVSASINYIYGTKLYPPFSKDVVLLGKHIRVIWKSSNIQDQKVKYVKQWLIANIFPRLKTSRRANMSAMTSFLCYYYMLVVVRAET